MEVDHSNSGRQASSWGSFSKVDLPVVLFQLLLPPRPWLHCGADAAMSWGTRRSWSWALPRPEYVQGGRVGSRCCRNLAPPIWIPRRTRTERRFLNPLKHFTFMFAQATRGRNQLKVHMRFFISVRWDTCVPGMLEIELLGYKMANAPKLKQECDQRCSRGGRLVCQPASGFAEDQQSKNMHY